MSTRKPITLMQRGLTMVELLIAMAILVTVGVSTGLIFQGISQAWRTGQLRTERYQQARLLFDLFDRELSSCVASNRYPLIGTDGAQGTPIKPDSAYDELFFVGTLPGRAGLVERGYWMNAQQVLFCHDEEPADGDYLTVTADEFCGRDVSEFEVSFFDGTQWIAQWDGRPGKPQAATVPKAVRITLTIGEPRGEQFETIIAIPTS